MEDTSKVSVIKTIDKSPLRIAVVGSRSFKDYTLMKKVLSKFENIQLLVSGHAEGCDNLAEK